MPNSDLSWQECNQMLSSLIDEIDSMSDWESEFVNDLAEYEEQGKLYSDLQKEKIEELHNQYC